MKRFLVCIGLLVIAAGAYMLQDAHGTAVAFSPEAAPEQGGASEGVRTLSEPQALCDSCAASGCGPACGGTINKCPNNNDCCNVGDVCGANNRCAITSSIDRTEGEVQADSVGGYDVEGNTNQ